MKRQTLIILDPHVSKRTQQIFLTLNLLFIFTHNKCAVIILCFNNFLTLLEEPS